MQRAQCPVCNRNPVAINYRRGDKVYYRSKCTPCIHQKRQLPAPVPGWLRSGYPKKDRCDRCGFKFKLSEQSDVYYIDGDVTNNHWANLRTICRNCQSEVAKSRWRPGTIQPDF